MVIEEIASIFLKALFPVVLVAGIGVLADRFLRFDLRSVSLLGLYIFAPALIFTSLMEVQVNISESFRVLLFGMITMFGMALIGWLYAHLCRFDGKMRSSVVLSVSMFNAVNFGFPFLLFAFGDEGLRLGVVLVACNGLFHNGFATFVAARAVQPMNQAFRALWRMPVVYATGLAVLFRLFDLPIPDAVFQPIAKLGLAGIPLLLVVVGMELGRAGFGTVGGKVWGAVALRLLVAPILAWSVASLVGLTGPLRDVVILQVSMPTAILPIVYAREFGSNVGFLSQVVLFSTLLSLLTLPILLILLQ